jgi:hypothetical protein
MLIGRGKMPLPKTLKDEKILESRAMMIPDAQNKVDYFFDSVQKLLEKNQAPGVKWEMGEVTTNFWKGLFGKKRDYILVTNEALNEYKIYIGAREYGTNLDIQYFLTCEPGLFKKMDERSDKSMGMMTILDIFAQQDLRAYSTVVRRCIKEVAKTLVKELGQDIANIENDSKGFLEVW